MDLLPPRGWTSCSRKSIHHVGRKSIQRGGNRKSIQRGGRSKGKSQYKSQFKSSTNHSSNHSISQETQRNYQANINQFKQAIIDFKSIIASDSSNTQTDFDIVFLDTFPDVAANYQSKDNKELSERESIAVCPIHLNKMKSMIEMLQLSTI